MYKNMCKITSDATVGVWAVPHAEVPGQMYPTANTCGIRPTAAEFQLGRLMMVEVAGFTLTVIK